MSSYNVPLPPAPKDGKYLSAYWLNTLSEYVNNAGNFVYGANVPWWLNPTAESFLGIPGMYAMQHKYDTLRIVIDVQHASDVSIRLSKRDDYTAYVQPVATHYGEGIATINIDMTSVVDFTVTQDELYFVYVSIDRDSPIDSDMNIITMVAEIGTGLIVAPSPSIPTIAGASVIDKAYLDKLRNGAMGLSQYTVPTNTPFSGVASNQSWTAANTVFRWRMKHINRYLHMSFLKESSVPEVQFYIDGTSAETWTSGTGNGGLTRIYDMTALPNSIAEPAFGATYEIKFKVSTSDHLFRVYYAWELPYL